MTDPQEAVRAATAGASLSEGPGLEARCEPLPLHRLAAPFEALRDRADAWAAEHHHRPQVFLACLGPLAEHTARTTWIRNLLAAGGVEGVGPEEGPDGDAAAIADAAVAALAASGQSEAIVCGTDRRYAEVLPTLVPRLKEAGAAWVTVAGAPGDRKEADAAAGVDGWVQLGQDVLAFLEALVARLTGEVSA